MHFHLHRNSKKWTIYSVKILKCEYFLIVFSEEIKKKLTFLLRKIY